MAIAVKRGSFLTKAVMLGLVLALFNIQLATATTGTTSSSSILPTYYDQWGSAGTGNGQFSNTNGMAIDSKGNIYIADHIPNGRIQKFSPDGTFITSWGTWGVGDSLFDGPMDIAIDSSDNVYVVDLGRVGRDHIQKFTSDGEFITSWGAYGHGDGQVVSPEGIAVDNNGNVYVVSTGNDRIVKFAPDGTFVTAWGSSGVTVFGEGVFNSPTGIAVDDGGNVYVADQGSQLVQKFATDGTFLAQFGGHGTGNGQLDGPHDVAIDRNGYIYITDSDNDRIQKFNPDFTFAGTWGSLGAGNSQFNEPRYITADNKGGVYVSDYGNTRIQKFVHPQNLATLTAANSSSAIELALPEGSNITAIESINEPVEDRSFVYPLGLVNFTFESNVGATTEVAFSFETDLKPGDVTARKYDPTTQTYTNIANATITETTVNGNPGLQLVYEVTDGGILDEDGLANGLVVDPVGLATIQASTVATPGNDVSNNTPDAPNTGYGSYQFNPLLTLVWYSLGAIVLLGLSVTVRKRVR